MASPSYFSKFPNINYAWKMNKAGLVDSIHIKDYFHLAVPRDDIFRSETIYSEHIVENGMRPDQVSYEVYGDEQYYWIILQVNQITDFYNQWPMSQLQLDDFLIRKYGSVEETDKIRYYKTQDVFDQDQNLVLPGGMIVPGDFNFRYPLRPGSLSDGYANVASGAVIPVTNRKHEYDLNFEKSRIEILQQRYIPEYVRDVRRFSTLLKSRELVGNISSASDLGDLR